MKIKEMNTRLKDRKLDTFDSSDIKRLKQTTPEPGYRSK